jgi:hypothetical protein
VVTRRRRFLVFMLKRKGMDDGGDEVVEKSNSLSLRRSSRSTFGGELDVAPTPKGGKAIGWPAQPSKEILLWITYSGKDLSIRNEIRIW